MTSSGQIADRRAHLRFEVLGGVACSLLSSESLGILNIGATGALVETALPLPVNAEYRMQLVLPTHVSDATVKVRRVTPIGTARYQIGLEFLAIPREAEEVIGQLVAGAQVAC
jgi:hypothetical protein